MQEVGSRRAFARLGHRLSRWVYVDRPAETAGECPYMHSFNAQRWYGLDVLVSERPNYREILESSFHYFAYTRLKRRLRYRAGRQTRTVFYNLLLHHISLGIWNIRGFVLCTSLFHLSP